MESIKDKTLVFDTSDGTFSKIYSYLHERQVQRKKTEVVIVLVPELVPEEEEGQAVSYRVHSLSMSIALHRVLGKESQDQDAGQKRRLVRSKAA